MFLPKKILVIDDDDAVFYFLQRKLGYLYRMVSTTEPGLAVDCAIRENPDLILCDIDMPKISGGELSVKFLECEYTRRIPFMYLTSYVSPSEISDLRGNIGGRHCIAKATPAYEMIERIEQMLQSPSAYPSDHGGSWGG